MKFQSVLDETQEMFNELLNKTSLPSYVRFKLVHNPKQKTIANVVKASDLYSNILSLITGEDYERLIVIILNEEWFDKLSDENLKTLVLEEALASVSYDMEKDRISIEKPNVQTFMTILKKYGVDETIKVKEIEKSFIDEEKAQKADSKKKKK